MDKKLYLASQSVARGRLLKEAGFVFEVISQDADEKSCDWGMPIQKLTSHIAGLKMKAVSVPAGEKEGAICWIITADSLCVDNDGSVFGKPLDHEDALQMVKSIRDGAVAGTSFCIERRRWECGQWITEERYIDYAQGKCILDVPDDDVEWYFKKLKELSGLNYLKLAGAFSITGVGDQFMKDVSGSYTAILGLPMYELRKGLKKIKFL
jgi:septum formation protein